MREPQALWAALLALLPWFFFLRSSKRNDRSDRDARDVPSCELPSFFALLPRYKTSELARDASFLARIKKALSNVDLARAALRSLVIVFVVLLWSAPSAPMRENARATRSADSFDLSEPSRESRVLIVDCSDLETLSPNEKERAAARQIAWALDPKDGGERVASRYLVELSSTLKKSETDVDVVILANAVPLSDDERETLEDFLTRKNAALILWAGDRTSAQSWNEFWKERKRELRTEKTPIAKRARALKNTEPTPLESAFRDSFPSFETSGLDDPPIETIVATVGEDEETILRANGSKTPIFSRIDENAYWIGADLSLENGAFAFMPCFPTFVERAVSFAREASAFERSTEKNENARTDRTPFRALWILLALALCADLCLSRRVDERAAHSAS